MKGVILWFMFSSLMGLSFMGISLARNLVSGCYDTYNVCKAYCDKQYSTPEVDVWGMRRYESNITSGKRKECKARCQQSQGDCIRRKSNLEGMQNIQTRPIVAPPLKYGNVGAEQESQEQEPQEGTVYENSPSDTTIYKWIDKNGVVQVTNKKESIPSEYLDQLEETSSKEATNVTEEKTQFQQRN